MKAFTTGQTLKTSFAGDHNAILEGVVISRTAKTVKVDVKGEGIKSLRIFEYKGQECVRPLGKYSMCPTFRA